MISMETLVEQLRADGRLPNDWSEDDMEAVGNPLFVTIMTGLGAWLATFAFLAFYFLSSFVHVNGLADSGAMIVTGFALLGVTFLFNPIHDFSRHLRIAFSIVGQVLIIVGLYRWVPVVSISVALIVLVEIGLFFAYNNFLLRLTALWLAIFGVVYWLNHMLLPEGIHVLVLGCAAGWSAVMLREPVWIGTPWAAAMRVLVPGLSLAVFMLVLQPLRVFPAEFGLLESRGWLSGLGLTLVLVIAIRKLLQHQGLDVRSRKSMLLLVACALAGLVLMPAPGATAGLLIIILAYSRGQSALLAFAVLYSLSYFSVFYYQLNWTLLVKSVVFFVAGLVLLSAHQWWRRAIRNPA